MSLNGLYKITDKQRDFAKFYRGDVVEALKASGHTGSDIYLRQLGNDLIKQPQIIKMIQEYARLQQSKASHIADKEEIQSFLTNTMRNQDHEWRRELDNNGEIKELGNLTMTSRLKAAELLGKSQGLYVDKLDVSGKLTLTDIIQKAYLVEDDDLDAIEAEYVRVNEVKKIKAVSSGTPDPFEKQEVTETFEGLI